MNQLAIDRPSATRDALSHDELHDIDAYWRACNYLALGMLYLRDNPLLREPLVAEHIKERLVGHWGSDPGQSFVWVHLNRLIKKYDLNAIYIAGPGHGAPATLANAYLEGRYSEVYPDKSENVDGMRKFFKQFSFPGGIGSHCTPETPGSIHEGGELGYSVSRSVGRPPWARSRGASASGRRSSSTCRSPSGGGLPRRQQLTRVPGDHQVFVGFHHAHDHSAAVVRDDRRVPGAAFDVEAETQELEALADAFTDGGGVVANPGREEQRVDPAERGDERAHGLPREVAEQGERVGGAWIARLLPEQVAHVAAEPRHAEESGLMIDEPVQRRSLHALRFEEMQEHARIQIARSPAHHDPAGRREAHGRVDAHTLANGGEAGSVPQVYSRSRDRG